MATKKQLMQEKKARIQELEDACEVGDTELAVRLIREGLAVDTRCIDQRTPLHLAVKGCHPELVQALLELRGDVAALDYRSATPLHLLFGKTEDVVTIASALLQAGAPVNARQTHGSTVLHHVCASPAMPAEITVKVVELFLAAGAEVNVRNHAERTPLWYAATYGTLDVVKALVKGGADPRMGMGEQTPVEAALEGNHSATVEYLRSVGG